ncbi:pyridoxal phosphate-dependent aminotransferase [bacterium]|nr:pyridoxal phosphate-dependent aminotransferase [bacterium]
MQVSQYAASITPSATMAAGAKAKELKAQGINVFDFATGEPDFITPAHICAAATQAMKDGHTKYTPSSGLIELKQAVADYHRQWHGLDYAPASICVSSGAKHTIYSALLATLNPGDEVIIPTPYWVSYSELVKMAGAVPILVETTRKNRFLLKADQFRSAITPKTKMLMLNSPSNPTGSAYAKDELESIAKIIVDKNLICLSDEIYERLIYTDTPFVAMASFGKDVFDRTLTVNGVSKTYAMTGWRIGWTCGPANIIKAMDSIQGQQTSNPSSISQWAAIAALRGEQQCVEQMKVEFVKRRDYVCQRLNAIAHLSIEPPDGAFYAFFDVSAYFGKTFGNVLVKDSQTFCLALLEQGHVNTVQGSAFGAEGYARMSFATSMETIRGGLDALEAWLATGK